MTMANERTTARAWLGAKEAAAYLGVSRRFLYRHKDDCPPAYIVAGNFRYLKAQLDDWLERQRFNADDS